MRDRETLIEELRELARTLRYRASLDPGPMGRKDEHLAGTCDDAAALIGSLGPCVAALESIAGGVADREDAVDQALAALAGSPFTDPNPFE